MKVDTETPQLDKLLTVQEVAERLRKTPKQLRWMIHAGTAPKSALIGSRRMFLASSVESFIDAAFSDEQASA